MFRNERPDSYKVQANGVGLGWSLGGISYIARADARLDDDEPDAAKEFAMVLNSQFVRIQNEDGAWRTDPAIFAQIGWSGVGSGSGNTEVEDYAPWTVVTSDGTRYTFGDTGAFSGFSGTSAVATFVETTTGNNHYRLAKEWYLAAVEDPLGNRMEYSYTNEQGTEQCYVGEYPYLQWYNRAIYPSEIRWSQHTSGVGPHLRATFTYAGSDRQDYKVDGWGGNDCKATKYALRNRLDTITIQAQLNGDSWTTLRSYTLSTSYSAGVTVTGKCDGHYQHDL